MIVSWGNLVVAGVTEREQAKYPPIGLSIGKTGALSAGELVRHRQSFADSIRMPVSSLKFQRQVHGSHVAVVDPDTLIVEGDGMITNRRGIVLCALVADCCGILLYDKENQSIGAIHSGWRGTHLNIARHAVDAMAAAFGTDPAQLLAFLSPCASGERYVVRKDVAEYFPTAIRQLDEEFYLFDNRLRIRQQLLEAGLQDENMTVSTECSIDNPAFHSYRRDGDNSGRTAVYIGLK